MPLPLHEYETLLFAKPDEFELFYPNEPKAIQALQKIATDSGNIELINDGSQTAPRSELLPSSRPISTESRP